MKRLQQQQIHFSNSTEKHIEKEKAQKRDMKRLYIKAQQFTTISYFL